MLYSSDGKQCQISPFVVTEARFVCQSAPYQMHFKLDHQQEWDPQVAKEKYGIEVDFQTVADDHQLNVADVAVVQENTTLLIALKK